MTTTIKTKKRKKAEYRLRKENRNSEKKTLEYKRDRREATTVIQR
jgi:hypothetical protein